MLRNLDASDLSREATKQREGRRNDENVSEAPKRGNETAGLPVRALSGTQTRTFGRDNNAECDHSRCRARRPEPAAHAARPPRISVMTMVDHASTSFYGAEGGSRAAGEEGRACYTLLLPREGEETRGRRKRRKIKDE